MFEHQSVLPLALLVALNVKSVDVGGYCIVWRNLVTIFLFIQHVIFMSSASGSEVPGPNLDKEKITRLEMMWDL